MRITIFMTSITGGGSERFSTVLANGLAQRGHEVHLLTGPIKNGEYSLTSQVYRTVLYTKTSLIKNAKSLRDFLKQHDIDICVAVGIYPNMVAALSNFCLKTKIVLSERNAPKEDFLSIRTRFLRKLLYWHGDAFVFQTPEAKAFYCKSIQKRGVVIPNPIKDNLPIRTNSPQHEIVAVGRLMPQKNYHMLLSAFAIVLQRHPEYILRIFGRGKYETELKEKANQLGIADKVIFEGFSLNVHEEIKNSEIYVLSSDFEGLPNALMEAMAMGFPVVSTDCPCGGPKMLIKNGINGQLVPVGDCQAMANALLHYIEHPDIQNKCAHEAIKAKELYCIENILDRWEHLFSKLVKTHKTVIS